MKTLPWHSKVGRLSNVEAVIEAAVVGVGEGDDDVSFFLNNFLIGHAVLVQDLRRDHAGLVAHKVGTPKTETSYFESCQVDFKVFV